MLWLSFWSLFRYRICSLYFFSIVVELYYCLSRNTPFMVYATLIPNYSIYLYMVCSSFLVCLMSYFTLWYLYLVSLCLYVLGRQNLLTEIGGEIYLYWVSTKIWWKYLVGCICILLSGETCWYLFTVEVKFSKVYLYRWRSAVGSTMFFRAGLLYKNSSVPSPQ